MAKLFKILKFILTHPLSGKHKIKAVSNFFLWQLSQSLSPRLVVRSFAGNTKLWVKKGMEAATANIYTGLHEFSEMGFLLHFLKEEDIFVDVGANIGAYTVLASGVIGCNSVSIEPVPTTYNILEKNIQLNNIENKVLALNLAMGSNSGYTYFTSCNDSTNRVVLKKPETDSADIIKVKVKSLDDVLSAIRCPALIKVDVEGYEYEVIKGANSILKNENLKAIIIELNGGGKNYGFNEDEIHNILLSFGFNPYEYFPFERQIQQVANKGANNTIYLRDPDLIIQRIKNAEKVKTFSEYF